jgi:tRNA wybutosine-synthesizing protein 2
MRIRRVVPADLGRISTEDWVDPARKPCIMDGTACVPVRNGYPCDDKIAEPVQYRGRGFFMLGDIAILHGTPPSADELDRIIALRHPRGVIRIRSINEVTRTPDCEVLYGNTGEVCHKENGFSFILDPCRVMFSQGNLAEKRRMAALVRSGPENGRVADMFAGIGYFAIPMAGAGASVHAIEINPVSYGYLVRNIDLNHLKGRITPELGDCRSKLTGIYDRIVMGHFDAVTMLPAALAHVRTGSVIHLHSIGDMTENIRSHLAGSGFSADLHVHKVKKYGPYAWHLVQDIVIR